MEDGINAIAIALPLHQRNLKIYFFQRNHEFQALFTSQSVTFAAMPYALSMI
jgi:hypothetical protein